MLDRERMSFDWDDFLKLTHSVKAVEKDGPIGFDYGLVSLTFNSEGRWWRGIVQAHRQRGWKPLPSASDSNQVTCFALCNGCLNRPHECKCSR
jgi:hypothetical protein